MMSRTSLLILRGALALSLIALAGCTSVRKETRYVITQQATLPAPGGQESVGRMTAPGKFSAQGGAKIAHSKVAETAKDRSEFGARLLHRTFHGRVGFGVSERIEIGASALYGNTLWTQNTSDVEIEGSDESGYGKDQVAHLFWGGIQARGLLVGNRFNGIALFGEFSMGRVPFIRHVDKTTTYYGDTIFGSSIESEEIREEYVEESVRMHAIGRAGGQGFVSFGEWVTVTMGGMMQTYPRYWARRVTGQTCGANIYDGQPASCTGDTPESINSHNTILFGTLFAGASVGGEFLPGSLHVQLYHNTLSPQIIRSTSPFGLDFHVRMEF